MEAYPSVSLGALGATRERDVLVPANVEAQDVRVQINGRDVLKGINVDFPEHEVTAIIGPTGCGKTTLLRALNRLHDGNPAIRVSGKVRLNGIDVYSRSDVRSVRRRMGMLFQRPNPFPRSILENVTIGPKSHHVVPRRDLEAHAEAKLREVGLWNAVKDRLKASPFFLSGGQQQQLCLARSLSVEPDVLLLDEPTSSLDPASTQTIEDLIGRLRERMTVILVTHNLRQAARVANQVLFLMEGEQVEFSPAHRFFRSPADERSRAYVAGAIA